MAFSFAVLLLVVIGFLLLGIIFLNVCYKRREERMLVRAMSSQRVPQAVEMTASSLRRAHADDSDIDIPVATAFVTTAQPIGVESSMVATHNGIELQIEQQEDAPEIPNNDQPPEPPMPPPSSAMPVRRPSTAERRSFLETMHAEGKMSDEAFRAAMSDISTTADGELACT